MKRNPSKPRKRRHHNRKPDTWHVPNLRLWPAPTPKPAPAATPKPAVSPKPATNPDDDI